MASPPRVEGQGWLARAVVANRPGAVIVGFAPSWNQKPDGIQCMWTLEVALVTTGVDVASLSIVLTAS